MTAQSQMLVWRRRLDAAIAALHELDMDIIQMRQNAEAFDSGERAQFGQVSDKLDKADDFLLDAVTMLNQMIGARFE